MKFRATNLMIGTLGPGAHRRLARRLARHQKFAGIQRQVPFRLIFEGSGIRPSQRRRREF